MPGLTANSCIAKPSPAAVVALEKSLSLVSYGARRLENRKPIVPGLVKTTLTCPWAAPLSSIGARNGRLSGCQLMPLTS